jgi:hypothetical protein
MVYRLLIKGKYFLALWSGKRNKPSCRCGEYRRGKSGQHRVPYFLTGRQRIGDDQLTASATENIPPGTFFYGSGKGEKVG